MDYVKTVAARHSAYMLDDNLKEAGVSQLDVLDTLRAVASNVPSSYNTQSVRMFVLFGEDHKKLWAMVEDILRAKVDDDKKFKRTEAKLRSLAKGAGTVLFYELDSLTDEVIESNPKYAGQMRTWAEHGNAMAQYASWLAFYDLGLGANIQHYNPIIDDRVKETFSIPDGYRLVAQMVFGRVTYEGDRKDKVPGYEIVKLARAKE